MRGLAIDARYRVVRNLCQYPNAESGVTTGWVADSTVTISAATEEHHSGAYSYKAVVSGASAGRGIAQVMMASSGTATAERCSVWVKAVAGAMLLMVTEEYNGGTYVGQRGSVVRFTTTGAWQRVSTSATKTGGAANVLRAVIRTDSAQPPQAVTFYVDDAMNLNVDIDIPYADGNSPNWRWDGTPNASTSRGIVFVP